MRRILSLSLIALLAVGAGACGSDSPTAPVPTIEQTTFAASLGVDLSKMTKALEGYYYQDTQAGTGDIVRLSDSLDVSFNGYLADGTTFALANTQVMQLGVTPVMQGWALGLLGAPIGGRRRLIIPPSLGYGDRAIVDGANGKVVVPKNSVLIYDITILRVRGR